MRSYILLAVTAATLLAWTVTASAQRAPKRDHWDMVHHPVIERLGGLIKVDPSVPGKPFAEVELARTPVKDSDLAELVKD